MAEQRSERVPGAVRAALSIAVGALIAGALYLIVVRGEALLLDLAAVGQFLGCW